MFKNDFKLYEYIGYQHKKWNWRTEFKFWMRIFSFQFVSYFTLSVDFKFIYNTVFSSYTM